MIGGQFVYNEKKGKTSAQGNDSLSSPKEKENILTEGFDSKSAKFQ